MEKIEVKDFIKLDRKLLKGKIICFPTDTVYGVGALYDDIKGIDKIYEMKKRSKDKPLVNLCSNIHQIELIGIEINDKAKNLMEKYWPGALTIILKDKEKTTSFRMPNCNIALQIIDKFSMMATTSVNESGEPELNSIEEIEDRFGNYIDYFVTDKVEFSKIPSTVVDASKEELVVLRAGSIKI